MVRQVVGVAHEVDDITLGEHKDFGARQIWSYRFAPELFEGAQLRPALPRTVITLRAWRVSY